MLSITENIEMILKKLPQGTKLVAVSKFHPCEAIMEAYAAGQRAFGENRPQEFMAKAKELPGDIEWHFIGHLQTNKLKMVLPYASMLQSVDSTRLLDAVNGSLVNSGRTLDCLLELHLGAEETKHGLSVDEVKEILDHASEYQGVRFRGLMGMATNTDDETVIRSDFARISALMEELRASHPQLETFDQLSIGMSGDYEIALEYGATIVRVGTGIFGEREY